MIPSDEQPFSARCRQKMLPQIHVQHITETKIRFLRVIFLREILTPEVDSKSYAHTSPFCWGMDNVPLSES